MTEKVTVMPDNTTPRSVIAAIIAISVLASAFLCWLVYFHPAMDASGTHLKFLPGLNALLNGLCAAALIVGIRHIHARRLDAHRNAMLTAFVFSSLFLVSYIANHALHGDMRFPTAYPVARFIYLWILLLPHILLAVFALPLILVTFFYSLSGRFPAHKRIARWTYPIWLYVSVSGVVVYAMLAAYK
jgi:putative membrane protein